MRIIKRDAFWHTQISAIYRTLFARQSTYFTFIVVGAFFGEIATEGTTNWFWWWCNKGVCLFYLNSQTTEIVARSTCGPKW